jgi:hypothetical protein
VSDRFIVYKLDSDLPSSIAKYPLMSDAANIIRYDNGPVSQDGAPIYDALVAFDQERKARIGDILTLLSFYSFTSPSATGIGASGNETRQLYYENSVAGDSASPLLLLYGDQIIYLGSLVGGGDGPNVGHRIGEVLAACKSLTSAHAPVLWGRENTRVPRTMTIRSALR